MGTPTGEIRRGSNTPTLTAGSGLKFRGSLPREDLSPLPPLPSARRADPTPGVPPVPEARTWSPVTVALPLFAIVWVCFAALAARVSAPPSADIAGLAHVLAMGAG